ncbi:MAG TPA: biotin transporter BioY [Bdellovibrio sp.]|nr:biotin transporter BioY [Bdellovibrio sp.]
MNHAQAFMSSFALRKGNSVLLNALIVISGAMLLSVLAQLSVKLPFTPVPVTGQTFGVALLSLVWGRDRGVASVLLYLSAGFAGLPVFALGKSGLMWGPTFGYLIGMLLASYYIGSQADRGRAQNFSEALRAVYVGSLLTFICGLFVLSFFIPTHGLLLAGLWPFLAGDCLKNILASGLAFIFYRRAGA